MIQEIIRLDYLFPEELPLEVRPQAQTIIYLLGDGGVVPYGLLPSPEVVEQKNIFELFQAPYSKEIAQNLLAFHKTVALKNGTSESAYFNFTRPHGQNKVPLSQASYKELSLKGGDLACFSDLEMACMIHEQMRAYVRKDTMGANFPIEDPYEVEQLVALMISGFDAETLMTVAQYPSKDHDNFSNPIALVRATIGNDSGPIKEHIGDQNSNLPTLSALTIPTTLLPEALANTPCNRTVCIGRFAMSDEALSAMELDPETYKSTALQVLCHLRNTFKAVNAVRPEPLEQIIFDTHSASVLAMSQRFFGAEIVVGPDQADKSQSLIQTTAIIDAGVLRHHYGGHQNSIYWMTTTLEGFNGEKPGKK